MPFVDPINMIETVVEGLGDLSDRFVFIGGAVTSLYYQDNAAVKVRPTKDVDCVVEIVKRSEYYVLEDKLRSLGFKDIMDEDTPICRKSYADVLVDVMPIEEEILGHTNKWYREGIRHSATATLPSGRVINIFTLPYFIATKLDAYHGRGGGDPRFSHDLEDIVLILDSQENYEKFNDAPDSVKSYIRDEFQTLASDNRFIESMIPILGGTASSVDRSMMILNFMQGFVKE